VNRVVRCKSWVSASGFEQIGQLNSLASVLRARPARPMKANTSSTDLGVSRTLSSLSNQHRLHGAHADISIGRNDPNASCRSGAIVSWQFEQSGTATL
jgi:hypothetical protein